MKGFLTKIDPETGEQKNMTFGLKSCESDLARLMEPIERTIEQQLNYTCGASSSNENQTAGPITYSLECCSTDDCNVGDNNNNTIEIIFPSEDITDIMQKDEENNKENNNENPIFSEENNNTFVSENSQENPTFTETGENKTFELTQNEDLTSSTPLLLLDNSTQPLEMETDNNTIISTNTTKENPRNGVNAIYNSFSMFSLLSTCLFIGSIIITY